MSASARLKAVAIDLGHGNVKCAYPSKTDSSCKLLSFPALAPVLPTGIVEDFSVARYEGVVVNAKGVSYFVGQDAPSYLNGTFSKPARDGYSHSPEYEALMLGALGHVLSARGVRDGDNVEVLSLGLGLPLTTYFKERKNLEHRWQGRFEVPLIAGGAAQVVVREVFVLAQPVGALINYATNLGEAAVAQLSSRVSLVLDAGGGTLDYLVTSGGVKVAPNRSGANEHGLDACTEAVAKKFGGSHAQKWLGNHNQLRAINEALSKGDPMDLAQGVIARDEYWPHVMTVVNAGISGALRAVGDLTDVRLILCVGGGGKIYADALRQLSKDPLPPLRVEEQPLFTNVKGFYAQAHRKALSYMRSVGMPEMEAA